MKFSEKLDFLMNMTKTSNSLLSLNTTLDASYISRLRNGKRKPVKRGDYIDKMASYFSKNLNEKYQLTSLQDAMGLKANLPKNQDNLSVLISEWLRDDSDEKTSSLEGFLDEFTNFRFSKSNATSDGLSEIIKIDQKDTEAYYGINGKRQVVISFLSNVIMSNKKQTLLLFSDENMEWLTGSAEFTMQWSALMKQVIMKGNRIKIIHTVSRDLDEMLSAVAKWMPLYMTGAIEPYYYPKKRDGVFRRTLFVSPDVVAVSGSSFGESQDGGSNLFTRKREIIDGLKEEFEAFLTVCRPLMKIFTPQNREVYFQILSEFEKESYNTIIKSEPLSIMSMPAILIDKISARLDETQRKMVREYYHLRTQNFVKLVKTNKIHEIIKIPEQNDLHNGTVMYPFTDMVQQGDIYYTIEDFKAHITNIILLLETYKNYSVHIEENPDDIKSVIVAKENLGVLVAKPIKPSVFLAINESNLTVALWDYLNDKIKKQNNAKDNKKTTIERLKKLIQG
ncbi:MAG: hypothetical protein KMY55_12320 [Dethiosulfatibacter sp.]|nr:hypothetical protein [Dethiosulfatibacter sp.]